MLTGLHVLDFSQLLPGPYATLRLADLGAKVVKVEPPEGDGARTMGPRTHGTGVVFLANNRNKESIVLDLKTPGGQKSVLRLMEEADVIVEAFRPGVAKRLHIDYDTAREHNPKIIYCALTGYGQTGPLSHLAGHDLNYQAASGVLSQLCSRDGRPVVPAIQLADLISGISASEAILAALVRRSITGEGAYLDISITDALTGILTGHGLMNHAFGAERGVSELAGTLMCYNLYETKDHRFVSLSALEPKFWQSFCDAVHHPEWLPSHFSAASDENPVYRDVVALFASRTLAEWQALGEAADCCLQAVLTVSEALTGPNAVAHHTVHNLSTEAWGTLRQVSTFAGGRPVDAARLQPPPTLLR